MRFESRSGAPSKRSVGTLQKKRAGLTPRTADENILQPVSIRVAGRQGRPLPRQHVREKRLALEIDEGILFMSELQTPDIRRLHEEWRGRQGFRFIRRLETGVPAMQRHRLIRRHALHSLARAIRPDHFEIDLLQFAQAEKKDRLHGRQIPPHRVHFPVKPPPFPRCLDSGADPEPVAFRAFEANLQVMPRGKTVRIVPVDKGFRVDVVDHKVEIPIVVQIGVCRTIRKGSLAHTPVPRLVCKDNSRFVSIDIVAQRAGRHLPDHFQRGQRFPPGTRLLMRIHQRTPEKIEIRVVAHVAIRDEKIVIAIEIEVGQQRRPAPVGIRNACDLSDFRESPISPIQLQHIAHILLVKPLTSEVFVKHMVLRPLQHFLPEMIFGQHIQRHDVGQRIVVYIGNVGPHGRVGRMRQKRAYGFGKRSVSVVYVQVIVLDIVVGNVEIGPGIPVQIANDHTEPEAQRIADDARRLTHVRKRSAVVPVQLVACKGVAATPHIVHIEAAQTPDRMIQQIQIQVAIPVVIEQGRVV